MPSTSKAGASSSGSASHLSPFPPLYLGVTHPIVAISSRPLLHPPKVVKAHAQVQDGVNPHLLALLTAGIINALFVVPESGDDIHINQNVAEVKGKLDHPDGRKARSLDAIRQRRFKLLARGFFSFPLNS